MKKAIVIEILILLALLLLALLLNRVMAEPQPSVQTDPIQTTTTAPPETEPPVTWKTYPSGRQISAQQYFVYDLGKQTYTTISGNGSDRIYPASITKLFTACAALEYLQPDKVITAGDALTRVVPGSSVADIQAGDNLSVEQLVEAMLLPSGNDAAYILAVEAGRVTEDAPGLDAATAAANFVARMNVLAKDAGMTGTNFVNPDGIHRPEHYTTFDDLVIMAKLALGNPTVAAYAGRSGDVVTMEDGTQKQWHNTNALIHPSSEYYCPYAVGLKTGQTPSAGSCLLSAFRYHGTTLIIGVFGCPDELSRFDDTLYLFNQAAGIE